MADTPITTGTGPLPAEPPTLPATAVQAAQRGPRLPSELPPVTTGTSAHYIHGLAGAASRASATDPLSIMFQGEKLPAGQSIADLDVAAVQRLVYASATSRLATKLANGAFVVEAAGFAAVACWEPCAVGAPPRPDVLARAQRPVFADFLAKISALTRQRLDPVAQRVSDGRYWKLSLMARDPAVLYVPGAGKWFLPQNLPSGA